MNIIIHHSSATNDADDMISDFNFKKCRKELKIIM
jgi:hypothetical protein